MKPTIGRIVEYVMEDGQIRPAIIVRVWSDICVQLQVFTDGDNDGKQGNVMWATSVLQDENKSPRSWDWMEFQKQQAAKEELKGLKEDLKDIHARHGGMDFSEALMCLKEGARVQRAGWNGKGLWAALVHEMNWQIFHGQGFTNEMALRPWLGLKDVNNHFGPWTPSTSDLLATDWIVLED